MPECTRCDLYFSSWYRYNQHVATSPRHNICDGCRLDHASLLSLKEHYRLSGKHHYCAPCDRHFTSENNLHAHLNSAVHHPKDVICPFRGCGAKFVSRSALVLHLENGACLSRVDRNTINRFIRQYDTNNVITDPSRLLTGSSSSDQSVKYIATAASWNGRGYECCLCHKEHQNLKALNQHLASPRHQDQIYLCRGPSCGQRFTALSALVQHIESDKCGVSKFRAVQNAMDSVLGQMGRLTMG